MATQHAQKILSVVNGAADEERERRKRLQRENAISRYEEACVTLDLPTSRTLPAGDAAAAAVFPTLRQKAAAATLHTAAAVSLKALAAEEAAQQARVPAEAAAVAPGVASGAAVGTSTSSNEREDRGGLPPATVDSPALKCIRATAATALAAAAPAPTAAVAGAVQSDELPAACKAGKTPASAAANSPFVKSKKARKVR